MLQCLVPNSKNNTGKVTVGSALQGSRRYENVIHIAVFIIIIISVVLLSYTPNLYIACNSSRLKLQIGRFITYLCYL